MHNKVTTLRVSGKLSWLVYLLLLSAIGTLLVFIHSNLIVKDAYAGMCTIVPRDPASQGYCDRSAPNTYDCTDVQEFSGCQIISACGGGYGTCVVINAGDNVHGGGTHECQCQSGPPSPTRTPTPTSTQKSPTPTPPRRDICVSASTSKSSMAMGETTNLISEASEPVNDFLYAFYNMDNLYSPENPKPLCVASGGDLPNYQGECPDGSKHLIYRYTGINLKKTIGTRTLSYSDIFKTDMNTGKIPSQAHFNAYFIDIYGKQSLQNSACTGKITRKDIPSITPTITPTMTITPTPFSKSPTPTQILSSKLCTKLDIFVNGVPLAQKGVNPKIGDKIAFQAFGSYVGTPIGSFSFELYHNTNALPVFAKKIPAKCDLVSKTCTANTYTYPFIYPFIIKNLGNYQVRATVR